MDTIQRNIKTIQNAGFKYLKIELEANTNCSDDDCNCDDAYTCECGDNLYTLENDMREDIENKLGIKLHYINAYNDGSVNTEVTLTIDTKNADKLPQIIRLFSDYASIYDTENAGLHISVLTDSVYPCNTCLDEVKLNNYRKQVKRLMPAILFLSTNDSKQARSFYYRIPRISPDKYSAIHELRGGFEYRLFEPCFDNPEKVLEYINVIAQTVQYYSKRKLKKSLYNLFEMDYTESTSHIYKFFGTPENRTALMACLPYIIKDKQKLIEKTKDLPDLKRNLAMRKELKLLNQYYEHLEKERKYLRASTLEVIRDQKRIADNYTCLSFNKRSIKKLYKMRLRKLPTLDKFIEQRTGSTATYTFRGTV